MKSYFNYANDNCRFNAADMGGMSRDMLNEALVLVKRLNADSRVNINNHWKV